MVYVFYPDLPSVLQHCSCRQNMLIQQPAKYRLIWMWGCVGSCKHYLSESEVPPTENNNLMPVFPTPQPTR